MKTISIIGIIINLLLLGLMQSVSVPLIDAQELNANPLGKAWAISWICSYAAIIFGLVISIYAYRHSRRTIKK